MNSLNRAYLDARFSFYYFYSANNCLISVAILLLNFHQKKKLIFWCTGVRIKKKKLDKPQL